MTGTTTTTTRRIERILGGVTSDNGSWNRNDGKRTRGKRRRSSRNRTMLLRVRLIAPLFFSLKRVLTILPRTARHAFETALRRYQRLRHQHPPRATHQHQAQHEQQVKAALPPVFETCNKLRALETKHRLEQTPFPCTLRYFSSLVRI